MKRDIFSKKEGIKHTSELAFHLNELLAKDSDLDWEIQKEGNKHVPRLLVLNLDGRQYGYETICELKPSVPFILELNLEKAEHGRKFILITPHLTNRILDTCKKRGIAAMDLNGRIWIRHDGLFIDRQAIPGRKFTYELAPRNIFVGKSARISRCLLTDHKRVWTQKEIVTRTGTSSGLVSRIVQHLLGQGILEKQGTRTFTLNGPHSLLDEWAAADRMEKRVRTMSYAGFLKPPQQFAHDLKEWAQSNGVGIAFTQWMGAWARYPFTEPVICSAYVQHLPDSASLDELGLRQVKEGGKLWLHVPDDEGVFAETTITPDDSLPVVSDAQLYLDLQHTGLRGPDAAESLWNWEGFCKP